VVKYRKIPPAAAANLIAENARIPPAADLQKNKRLRKMARRTEQLKIAVFFNFLQNRTRPSFFPHHTSIQPSP
jgi:hypothetical protein